jgi:hypothetical protein
MRSPSWLLAVLLGLVLASPSRSQTTLHGGDANPGNRLNILLVGDGWTSTQPSTAAKVKEYNSKCDRLIEDLFTSRTAILKDFQSLFVVTRVDVVVTTVDPAAQASAAEEEEKDPAPKAPVRPYYYTRLELPKGAEVKDDMMSETGGRVWFDDGDLPKAEERLVDTRPEIPRQVVVVILDSTENAGGGKFGDGGAPGICTITSSTNAGLVAHMLGHALFGLADEYPEKPVEGEPSKDAPATEPEEANATIGNDPAQVKWKGLVDSRPVEGGRYCSKGVWRPTRRCVMINAASSGFCAVCRERIRQRIYEVVTVIDKVKPEATEIACNAGDSPELEVHTIGPARVRIDGEWFLDGRRLPADKPSDAPNAQVFKLKLKPLAPGQHILRFIARDPPLPGKDRPRRPLNQRDWFIKVRDAKGLPALSPGDNKPVQMSPGAPGGRGGA